MKGLVDAKKDHSFPETLIITQHEPVITMGRRAEDKDLLFGRKALADRGIGLYNIERGGLITYHGPGQVVAYPIFRLPALQIGVADLVNKLEAIIITTLNDFGLTGRREPGKPGVWIGSQKIASIGLAVRRSVSFHGLSLNVNPDLCHFSLINPCGLTGVGITSMAAELGRIPDDAEVRERLLSHFSNTFNLDFRPWSLLDAQAAVEKHGTVAEKTSLA